MKLIAIHNLRRNELVKKADRAGEKDEYKDANVLPGRAFDEPDEEEAKRLIRLGAARKAGAEEAAGPTKTKPAGDELTKQMVEAIGKLKKGDFTAGGAPRVKAMEVALGFDVTEEERDAAWAAAQKK